MELYIKYKRNYVKGSANESELNFNWVLFFLLGYIVFLILLFSDIANILPKFPVSPFMVYTVLYLLYVGYYGIFRKNNLTKDLAVENQESDDETASKTFEGIAEKLEEILQKEKPYLDSKLTIDQLAKKINTNAKYLSNFLNSNHGMNFPTFINTHRIAESKALLLSDETSNFTIETIANMAGFHSKSSFNTAFKKATGLTPSEFKKKIAS